MENIRVSVIMPCYNDGQYLQEAIDSLCLQENSFVELLIIDDGSDDNQTCRIIEEIACERIRILRTNHQGPSFARNEGIRAARGEYILPLDADDRIEHEYINKAMQILESNSKVGVVYCHADLFGAAQGPWMLPEYSFERMLIENLVFVTAMFRKADWEAVGGYRTDMKDGLEDYDFFIGMLAHGKDIVQIPEVLFHYRIKHKSRTTEFLKDPESVKRAFENIYEHHRAFYQEHADLYMRLLRNEIIQQRHEKEKLMQLNGWMDRLRKIPVIKWIGRKLLGR